MSIFFHSFVALSRPHPRPIFHIFFYLSILYLLLFFFSPPMQCLPGYGLSKDTTQCNKCLTPNCAICDGDVSVCTQQNLVEDPHCSYWQDSVSGCIECEEGYTLLGQTCLKCLVPNCGLCDPSRLKTCRDVSKRNI